MTLDLNSSFFHLVNKPQGISSQKCVSILKSALKIKKVGHNGTLDPFATGLMLIGFGKAPRFFQYIDDSQKTYEAELVLGERTDTLDCEGKIMERCQVPSLTQEQINSVLQSFLGESLQMPPMYSAIKVNGKKLYQLARKGQEVERKPRKIQTHKIELLSFDGKILRFVATVSRGTYIRVLGEDIAKACSTVGHLKNLKRVTLNGFSLEQSSVNLSLNEKTGFYDVTEKQRVALPTLLNYPDFHLETEDLRLRFCHGGFLKISPSLEDGFYKIYHANEFLGLGILKNQMLKAQIRL